MNIDPQPLLESFDGVVDNTKTTVGSGATFEKDSPPDSTSSQKTETGVATPPVAKTLASASAQKKAASPFSEARSPSRALLIGAMLVMVILIIGIKKVVDKYAHERVVDTPIANVAPIVNPTDSAATTGPVPTPGDTSSLILTGVAPASALPTPAVTGAAAIADETETDGPEENPAPVTAIVADVPPIKVEPKAPVAPEAKPQPKPELKALPKPELKALPKPEIKPEVKAAPPSAVAKAPAPSKTESAQKPDIAKPLDAGKPQEVIIEALDSVEVTVQVDGEPAKILKLTPESIHTIKAKSQIELQIADGGMVNLIHNGHEKGVPGVLGKPVKIKFP